MRDNISVRDADPHNLLVAVLGGLPKHNVPRSERMQDMPGFAQDLNDADVAELSTWLRQRYGWRTEQVKENVVRGLREGQPSALSRQQRVIASPRGLPASLLFAPSRLARYARSLRCGHAQALDLLFKAIDD